MLGPDKPRRLDEPIAVSLEDLVPADHFYRHLEAKLDLSFVREWAEELYAERGRPSIDPVVFFKLQLVMFFEGIRSERKLIEIASLNLGHRYSLGYALDGALLERSSQPRIANTPARSAADPFTPSTSQSTASRATSGRPDPVPTQPTTVTAAPGSCVWPQMTVRAETRSHGGIGGRRRARHRNWRT
jgi:hypothetical protein